MGYANWGLSESPSTKELNAQVMHQNLAIVLPSTSVPAKKSLTVNDPDVASSQRHINRGQRRHRLRGGNMPYLSKKIRYTLIV